MNRIYSVFASVVNGAGVDEPQNRPFVLWSSLTCREKEYNFSETHSLYSTIILQKDSYVIQAALIRLSSKTWSQLIPDIFINTEQANV